LADRLAGRLVGAGGLAVVASLAGILIFLLWEVGPLLARARVEIEPARPLPGPPPAALALDPDAAQAALLGSDGVLRVRALDSGAALLERPLLESPQLVARAPGEPVFAAAGAGGPVAALEPRCDVAFRPAGR